MNNIVSIAMSSGKALYEATDDMEWNVTFLTNEVKRGRIVPVDEGVFALVSARQVFFFNEEHVVHISPTMMRQRTGRRI
jgi:hypothetical protein